MGGGGKSGGKVEIWPKTALILKELRLFCNIFWIFQKYFSKNPKLGGTNKLKSVEKMKISGN